MSAVEGRAAMLAIALLCFTGAAPAGDVGPSASVGAIRHDVPVLFAGERLGGNTFVVDRVVSDDSLAVAAWHSDYAAGLAVMRRRFGVWWLIGYADHSPGDDHWTHLADGPDGPHCSTGFGSSPAPSARDLVERYGFPLSLAEASVTAFAVPTPPPVAYVEGRYGSLVKPGVEIECYHVPYVGAMSDGYSATLNGVKRWDDATKPAMTLRNAATKKGGAAIVDLADISILPNSQTEFSGVSLDLWCPFVVDPSKGYRLVLHLPGGEVRIVEGILVGNTLHFPLPDFSLKNGSATARISVDAASARARSDGI